ncbi:MAG TPA: DUF4112 domain-containing protein [Longimicrobiaceae bacterium]|nr:DUF4112 domain-containing protein [Longimicrobiaceae bacterium]
MATTEVVRDERRERAVRRLDTLGYLLDDSIPIPGTGVRFGIDAVLGLVPGLGDVAGVVLSSYIVLQAARLGAGASVLLRMLLNLLIDGVVGAIPFLGDLFDAGWKANDRNLRLLHRALDDPHATRRASTALVLGVALLLLALLAGTVILAWLAINLVLHPYSAGG